MKAQKILIPVDFSECSKRALEYGVDLARQLGARIDVLHVIAPPPYVPLDMMIWGEAKKDWGEKVDDQMRQLVATVTAGGFEPIASRVETGIPYETIVNAAESVDLVVMGTHGRTGLPHVLLGSVAERVVRLSTVPVLTVPSK